MADQVYDLTQTGAQVQVIINDANKVMGAGSQSTLTTDSILLKDTSGNYHKIDKSSFTEAVRNTMASLLVNNDKGTTISHIAAIASGDFGSVTPANLASVLGGVYITIAPSESITNLDSMVGEQNTLFRFGQQTINNNTNAYGLGRCIIIRDYAYQEIVNISNMKKYYRAKYTPSGQTFEWPSTWKEIATV